MTLAVKLTHFEDPLLEFGEGAFATPKEGLAAAGPYSLRLGAAHRRQLHVGIVGSADTIRAADRFIARMRRGVRSKSENLALFPDFPPFADVFASELHRGADVVIAERTLTEALARRPREAFAACLELWADGIESLSERELVPDLVVCALPPELLLRCRRVEQPLPARVRVQLQRDAALKRAGQATLFDEDEHTSIEQAAEAAPEDLLFRDFRLALKARAMRARMPIQLLTEHTWDDENRNEDPATRAWNLSVAMFYKAGGIPWRTRPRTEETCFVGVSFHHLRTTRRHIVYSSVAQAFSSDGEGYALRGEARPWNEEDRQTHMSASQAEQLLSRVLNAYRERAGRTPVRLVMHKTSAYTNAEHEGIKRALSEVPVVQMLTLRDGDFRLIRAGTYPPHRGTACQLGDARYLFTVGYMPQVLTYPGPHIPVPLELRGAEADFDGAVEDLLALTKMNWNSARSWASLPISLSFARKVGGVMAELPAGQNPRPSFRYYM
jgi:hypothetical protein